MVIIIIINYYNYVMHALEREIADEIRWSMKWKGWVEKVQCSFDKYEYIDIYSIYEYNSIFGHYLVDIWVVFEVSTNMPCSFWRFDIFLRLLLDVKLIQLNHCDGVLQSH